jgi:hypothetical protein
MELFHRNDYSEREPWSYNKKQKQHQNQKQNPLGKRKPVSSLSRPRVPQNRLDTADFLIDGLLSIAPRGAQKFVSFEKRSGASSATSESSALIESHC